MHNEILAKFWVDANGDMETYLRNSINFIFAEAEKRGIEFEGYPATNRANADAFLIDLPEDYFSNDDRRSLYVLSAAMCSQDIWDMLDETLRRTPHYPLRKENIIARIIHFGASGISFLPSVLE